MRLKLTLITLLCAISMQAQTYTISGRTVDGKSQPVDMAAVRLMKGDSTFVSGQSTDSAGVFQFELKEAGEYILQFSFIGFNTQYRHVSLTAKKPHVSLGDIKLSTNDRLLSEATVTGHAAQVAIKEDTFVYNASAYRTPEGSTLEALVEKLPGAEVGDDGSIKINGKTVTQILVDGKDFFKGDTKVAMKNLPVDMVDKLKSYDKQSDYAKQTGIDDGNEETVLDVNMKQKLKSSWISNIDLAAGNHDRYSSNLFLNRFTDNTRITAFGSLNNTNDQRFRGGGPRFLGGGGGGLTASKMAGIDGFWNNGLNEDSAHYFEIGGNIRLSHSNSDHLTRSNSETFLSSSTASSFANSASHTYSKSSNINLEMNLSWKPDSMTWFRFRPSYSHTSSNSDGSSRSVTFNSDPYYCVDKEVKYGIIEDGYKEYMEMFHKWYADGIISPDFISKNQNPMEFAGTIGSGNTGVFFGETNMVPSYYSVGQSNDPDFEITPVPPITKTEGEATHFGTSKSPISGRLAGIAVTTTPVDLEKLGTYLDFFFTEEGALLSAMGVEETADQEGSYIWDENGELAYSDTWNNSELNEMEKPTYWIYSVVPMLCPKTPTTYYYDVQYECADVWDLNADDAWKLPDVKLNADEQYECDAIYADIRTVVEENLTKFAVGDRDMAEWDDFIDQLYDLGIEDCIALYQQAVDRYYAR